MARNNKYAVPYRRKREGKTNYHRRLKLLLGDSLRLVVRKSSRNVWLQVVGFDGKGDKVVASAHSRELAGHGWKANTCNTCAAYLVGLLLSKKVNKGLTCVLDIGNYASVKGCLLYAAVKGCVDGGMSVACSDKVFPDDGRISGKHVAEFAKMLRDDKTAYSKQFGRYLKIGFDPEGLPSHFAVVKEKIDAL